MTMMMFVDVMMTMTMMIYDIYILKAVNLDPDLAFVLQNAAQELAVTHTQHWTVMWKRFTITLMIMIHSETGNNPNTTVVLLAAAYFICSCSV